MQIAQKSTLVFVQYFFAEMLGVFEKYDSLYVKGSDMSINEFDWRRRR